MSLCQTLDSAVLDGLDKVPVKLNKSMKTLDTTQAHLQETVLALQDVSQNSANLVESLSELTNTANAVRFPP